MLSKLIINDFAIVEHQHLNFSSGMTVLTGETGAGKSIMLDALGLTLGNRADPDFIRSEADKADITAVFDITHSPLAIQWLREQDLLQADDSQTECIIRRSIHQNGRSRAYINDRPCTLNNLKTIGNLLIDLHSQHEHHSLLQSDTQLALLDNFANLSELTTSLKTLYLQWLKKQTHFNKLKSQSEEQIAKLQLLQYQHEELTLLALQENELIELEQELKQLSHAEEAQAMTAKAIMLCEGDSNDIHAGILTQIIQLQHTLTDIVEYYPRLAPLCPMLETAKIQIEEANFELNHAQDDITQNPERLYEIDARLSAIYQISRKHKIEPEQLLTFQASLSKELETMNASDEILESLLAEIQLIRDDYFSIAQKISRKREQAVTQMARQVNQHLSRLSLPNNCFSINLLKTTEPALHGLESAEYMIAANKGQPPKALSKTASGGELSRISLAIQLVSALSSQIPTLIFDEVDVGISGATAEIVGELLRSLGQHTQVICVTHQAQVAAKAHQHWQISKKVRNNSTQTHIKALDQSGKIEELARIMGGQVITQQTRELALEMLTACA